MARGGESPIRSMKKSAQAFSLIETALAIGVVSFALLAIVGVMPVGISVYQDAQNSSVETEIAGGVDNELQNAPYSTFSQTLAEYPRYYDVDGNDITTSGSTGSIYAVTLTSGTFLISGSSPLVSGTTQLSQIVQINVSWHSKTNVFSALVVNKGN